MLRAHRPLPSTVLSDVVTARRDSGVTLGKMRPPGIACKKSAGASDWVTESNVRRPPTERVAAANGRLGRHHRPRGPRRLADGLPPAHAPRRRRGVFPGDVRRGAGTVA